MAIALASLSVALVTAIFVAFQAHLARKHNRLSVRSHLGMEIWEASKERRFTSEMRLFNKGLGPAIIKSHKVFFDDRLIGDSSNISQCRFEFDNIGNQFHIKGLGSSVFPKNTAMMAGDTRRLVSIDIPISENFSPKPYEDLIVRFTQISNMNACMDGNTNSIPEI
jgi:hypothetical protein